MALRKRHYRMTASRNWRSPPSGLERFDKDSRQHPIPARVAIRRGCECSDPCLAPSHAFEPRVAQAPGGSAGAMAHSVTVEKHCIHYRRNSKSITLTRVACCVPTTLAATILSTAAILSTPNPDRQEMPGSSGFILCSPTSTGPAACP